MDSIITVACDSLAGAAISVVAFWGSRGRRLTCLHPHSLTREVLDFEQYVYHAQRSWDVGISHVITDIRGIVTNIWHDATVEAFGSYASGLWLPNSDVDLVIKARG